METKTLAFDVNDIEQFKEFFPDFKSGKMSGRELGSKLLEVLHNQAASAASQEHQVEDSTFKKLQADYQALQDKCNQLEKALQDKNQEQASASPETIEDQDLQEQIQALQDQLQAAIKDKKILEEKLQKLQTDNQHLQEVQETAASELQAQLQTLKDEIAARDARCKDLKAQLKEAASHQSETYTFTPYFKQMVEMVTEKINAISGTVYTPTDVIMQTVFATYFHSHTPMRYTYPVSKDELLALAQQFYPEIKSEKELFDLMIHKVKEEA